MGPRDGDLVEESKSISRKKGYALSSKKRALRVLMGALRQPKKLDQKHSLSYDMQMAGDR